jgi:hypothetical protein
MMQKFNDKAQSSIIGGTLLLLETCVQFFKRIYEREIEKWLASNSVVLEFIESNGDGVCNGGHHQNPNASSFVFFILFNNLLKTCLESLLSLNFWAMGIPMEKNGDGQMFENIHNDVILAKQSDFN